MLLQLDDVDLEIEEQETAAQTQLQFDKSKKSGHHLSLHWPCEGFSSASFSKWR